MKKPYQHLEDGQPFWPDNSIYFLTESTFLHFPYFNSYDKKIIVLEQIKRINQKLGIPISAFSIGKNHLHLVFYLRSGLDLQKIKQLLRGGISHEYNNNFPKPYGEMWQSRKTLVIGNQKFYWRVIGYVIGNLIKHQEVSTFRELYEDRFSSFSYMVDKYGFDEMEGLVRKVVSVKEDEWGEVDVGGLDDVV